jgi:hypothetical protein
MRIGSGGNPRQTFAQAFNLAGVKRLRVRSSANQADYARSLEYWQPVAQCGVGEQVPGKEGQLQADPAIAPPAQAFIGWQKMLYAQTCQLRRQLLLMISAGIYGVPLNGIEV